MKYTCKKSVWFVKNLIGGSFENSFLVDHAEEFDLSVEQEKIFFYINCAYNKEKKNDKHNYGMA